MGLSSLVLSVRSTEDHRGRGTLADLGGGDREPHWIRPRRCSKFRETVVGKPVDDKTSTRPEHRSDTHGARFTRCVDGPERELAEKVLLLEDLNESRLGMRRQIMIRVHPVVGFRDDLAIDGKEGAEWVVPVAACFFGQFENSAQQGVLVHAEETSAVSTNVRGVDVESGALSARTQDEGAVGPAARTRMPRAASLADRTAQRLVVAALASGQRPTPATNFRLAMRR
jgi:hypothetical protein